MIREAEPGDMAAIAALVRELGYDVTDADIGARLAAFGKAGHHVLVADRGDVIGVLTTGLMTVLHRPRPVGRISMMVVAEQVRGQGVGAALVAEAEARLRSAGCGMIEVTSNVRRQRAHAFYERLGYERTSHRFAKQLQE